MNLFTLKNTGLIIGDIIIAIIAVYAGVYSRFYDSDILMQAYLPILPRAIVFTLMIIFMCFIVDLYSVEKRNSRKEILLKIVFSGIIAFLVLGTFYYFVPYVRLGRGILFFAVLFTVLAQSVWHVSYDLFLKLPINAKKILILGTGPIAKAMGNVLSSNNNGFALDGYINCTGESVHVPSKYVVGSGDGLFATAMKRKVQKIVVSLSERRGTLPVREVLDCKLNGIEIVDGPSFYEQITGKLLIENMNPSHLIFSDGFRMTVIRRYIKRLFDLLLASAGLILSLPLFAIVPLLIKIDSSGTVLLKQKRIGEGEKEFILYKFRTMIDGAEKDSGPVWSQSGDKRITRLGKILRKTRIDELPQLVNVLHGDMSFIGPRPERSFFVESLKKLIPYYSERHCVKPGITGWAQIRYEYGDSIDDAIEKLKYDLYYIKYQSMSLDMLITLDTVKVVLFGRGGR